ncbi:MAG: hypothetical protein ACOVO5_08210 [Devosia sp.]|jgi:hypothetical protein|uniref:hypothetical protein n=1 Tax=Devosia sp. TaxID=1871048 RepID=UPI0037C0A04D
MRPAHLDNSLSTPRAQRNWVAETLVVLGIVAFGLFVLSLEGHFGFLAKPQGTVELPFDLTR